MGYTEEKLNSLDKETLIQLFLAQQEQLMQIDRNLQLVLEQLADQKRRRFGRSSEKHEAEGQIAFMEVDGQIVFFMKRRRSRRKVQMMVRKRIPGRDQKRSEGNGKKT